MTVNHVTENDGQTYANYILVAGKTFKVAITYEKLVTKILNGITLADRTENALCKEIVKAFLLSSADDLAFKFRLYEAEIKSIMNIRSVFYLHISKHFFATEGRHSTGSTNSVCTISESQCLPWQITNVEFFFKLMDVVRFDYVAQLLRSEVDNAREGSYGSCYFTLDTH